MSPRRPSGTALARARARAGRRAGGSSSLVVTLVAVLLALGLAIYALAGHGSGAGSSAGSCPVSGLPAQVGQTVQEIRSAGPFPYRQDGVTFDNREHLLPSEPLGYYREYTVTTPGSSDRGTRRVIAGGGTRADPAALYYTGDHYASFCRLTGAP